MMTPSCAGYSPHLCGERWQQAVEREGGGEGGR
jgi:hypothetical protein